MEWLPPTIIPSQVHPQYPAIHWAPNVETWTIPDWTEGLHWRATVWHGEKQHMSYSTDVLLAPVFLFISSSLPTTRLLIPIPIIWTVVATPIAVPNQQKVLSIRLVKTTRVLTNKLQWNNKWNRRPQCRLDETRDIHLMTQPGIMNN